MKKFLLMLSLLLLSLSFAGPTTVPFQAKLFQSAAGDLVPNNTYTMSLAIYTDAAGATTALWTETHTGVDVYDGNFGIFLGETTPFPVSLAASQTLYLKVTLSGQTVYGDLIPITSELFAQFANQAATASTSNFATKAGSLNNMNLSQFTNDSGFVTAGAIVVVNTVNYSSQAGTLTNLSIKQFTNDAGFITAGAIPVVNTVNYAFRAGTANSLSNLSIKQFTNDAGFITAGAVPAVSSVNYATLAGGLTNISIKQFTNDAAFITAGAIPVINTVNYANKSNTANVASLAMSIDASNIFGAITVSGSTVNVQQNLNVSQFIKADALGVNTLTVGSSLKVGDYTGQDVTLNVVVDTKYTSWGFLQKVFRNVVVKKGVIVSVGAITTK